MTVILRKGSSGSEVRQLQLNLQFLGFNVGTPDGAFGPNTDRGVRLYQSLRGLTADGAVRISPTFGETWTKLTGEVKWVQARLTHFGFSPGTIDGYVGNKTTRATKAFQKKYGLVADGIAGTHTRGELAKDVIIAPTPLPTPIPTLSPSAGLVFVERSEWGARPPKLPNVQVSKSGLQIIHHTETSPGPDEAAICRSIQNFHMYTRGWNDFAYNYGIGGITGRVFVGRGLHAVGAHTAGWNTTSVGVAVLGSYQDNKPSDVALNSLRRLEDWIQEQLGHREVVGHRDKNTTSCPGNAFYNILPR